MIASATTKSTGASAASRREASTESSARHSTSVRRVVGVPEPVTLSVISMVTVRYRLLLAALLGGRSGVALSDGQRETAARSSDARSYVRTAAVVRERVATDCFRCASRRRAFATQIADELAYLPTHLSAGDEASGPGRLARRLRRHLA